jgi:hypothetical protein
VCLRPEPKIDKKTGCRETRFLAATTLTYIVKLYQPYSARRKTSEEWNSHGRAFDTNLGGENERVQPHGAPQYQAQVVPNGTLHRKFFLHHRSWPTCTERMHLKSHSSTKTIVQAGLTKIRQCGSHHFSFLSIFDPENWVGSYTELIYSVSFRKR